MISTKGVLVMTSAMIINILYADSYLAVGLYLLVVFPEFYRFSDQTASSFVLVFQIMAGMAGR